MTTVEETAEFNTPVDKAFNLVADLNRWPEWIPPLSNVSNVSGTGMGTTYNWQFKLGPLPAFNGTGEVTKYIPNRRFEVQTAGIP
ncbi:MAG: SRPBCC family protein, partial [Anaerolineae bacterium]